jgi:hypothetical protein
MADKKELYVSIDPVVYRANKSNVLLCQADLLDAIKRLQNLGVLTRQKAKLKIQLYGLFSSVLADLDKIKGRLPTSKVPKSVKEVVVGEKKVEVKRDFSKRGAVDQELMEIQEKLRELNG